MQHRRYAPTPLPRMQSSILLLIVVFMCVLLNSNGFVSKGVSKTSLFFTTDFNGWSNSRRQHQPCLQMSNTETESMIEQNAHALFLKNIAKVSVIPKSIKALLKLLQLKGEEIVSPSERAELNPFLIPLSRNPEDNSLTCYIRWPTQKEDFDLQIVKTTETGIKLLSVGTDQLCHRMAVELDFYSDPKSKKAIEVLNKEGGPQYVSGDYMSFLKSGKFPTLTPDDMRLVLDRYLLTKVGAFPDSYERIALNFLKNNNDVSALVTCERAVSIFYGWGHPVTFHATMLDKLGRDKEAKDAARAAMGMPAWTVADTKGKLEAIAQLAGFSGTAILGEMHAFRANDPRKDDIGEGLSPIQVTLDQAAHLMDAISLGFNSTSSSQTDWNSIRTVLAEKYTESGYPEMGKFILS